MSTAPQEIREGFESIGAAPGVEDQFAQLARLSQAHYFFLPGEAISVADRNIGFKMIPRGRLRFIKNHPYPKENYSEAALNDPDRDKDDRVIDDKLAATIAEELFLAYGERGGRIVYPLTNASKPLAAWVEDVLVPQLPASVLGIKLVLLREVNIDRVPVDLLAEIEARPAPFNTVAAILEGTRAAMIEANDSAISYYDTFASARTNEMKRRLLPDGRGIDHYDPYMDIVLAQLERPRPDDEIAKARREAALAEAARPAPAPTTQCLRCGNRVELIDGVSVPEICWRCNAALGSVGYIPSIPTAPEPFPPGFTETIPSAAPMRVVDDTEQREFDDATSGRRGPGRPAKK